MDLSIKARKIIKKKNKVKVLSDINVSAMKRMSPKFLVHCDGLKVPVR